MVIKMEDRSIMNDLSFYLRKLVKEEQIKPKINQSKEIIEIRMNEN